MRYKEFLASFKPGFDPVPIAEKLRSGLGGLLGILFTGLVLRYLPQQDGYSLILLVPMAATATLLYAVPHSPMSQPWPVAFGHILSGVVGWACSGLISDPAVAGGCAVGLAIVCMHLAHCLHPPGGATALLMVLNTAQFHHQGWQWAAVSIAANALLSVLFALIINNLVPGRRYPMRRAGGSVRANGLTKENIEWALTQMDGMIDVSEEDLLDIYRLAVKHAGGGK